MAHLLTDRELVAVPLYSYVDVDYLAGVSRGTAKRWLTGYDYRDPSGQRVVLPPVTMTESPADPVASFVDLVEVIAIGGLKKHGLSLPHIRRIVRNCQRELGVERPLTTLRFKLGGRDIFVDRGEVLLEISKRRGNQAWTEFLEPFLQTLDYTHDTNVLSEIVRRWWPMGPSEPIVVDPAYGFGRPTVSAKGIRTEIILEHFQAKESIDEIANDFELSALEVERALQFELDRAA